MREWEWRKKRDGGQKCASACEMDGREVGDHMDHVDVHPSQLWVRGKVPGTQGSANQGPPRFAGSGNQGSGNPGFREPRVPGTRIRGKVPGTQGSANQGLSKVPGTMGSG